LDLKELKEILQILEEKEITEFELEEEGMKLRIRKAGPATSNHSGPSIAVLPGIAAPLPPAAPPPASPGPGPRPAAARCPRTSGVVAGPR